jgi:hypothetical protein
VTSFDADYLVPVLVDDIIPGDTFNVNMDFFCRLATPLHPIMDNIYLESFFFFVPYRLVWDNWEKMHGAQEDPNDSISYTVPVCTGGVSATGEGSLWDYFGLPLDDGSGGAHVDPDSASVTALPFRAYALIFNEWFRDQNLQDSFVITTDDGPDTLLSAFSNSTANRVPSGPIKRGKRHDYFTSALPSPQKGDSVSIPLGDYANVYGVGIDSTTELEVWGNTGGAIDITDSHKFSASGATAVYAAGSGTPAGNLFADLSAATPATVNDLRLAFQTQRLLERDARSGTRYNELILAHFGVTVPDFRIQRPEFLGGGTAPVNMNVVPSTTSIDSVNAPLGADQNLGDLAAFGTVSGRHGFTKSFVEHGVLIGLVNVRGDITYSQGIERYWNKSTRYDFYYPVLAQIGEQSILNKEIYFEAAGSPDAVFGYQERYAEYRYKPSRLTGLMSVDAVGTLESWHLSEEFTSQPTLGDTFIRSNTGGPLDRAIAVPSQPHFIGDFYFNMQCARPMPLFGIPGNLDHF